MAQDLSTKLRNKDSQSRGLSRNDYTDRDKASVLLPSNIGWWDFSRLTGLANNAKIPMVEDISGYGNPMRNATEAAQPTKSTAPNGLSCGVFNATQSLTSSLGSSFPLSSTGISGPVTIIIAVKLNSVQPNALPQLIRSEAATSPLTVIIDNDPASSKNNPGILYVTGNSLSTNLRGSNIFDDAWHTVVITIDAQITAVYVDGYFINYYSGGNLLLNLISGLTLCPLGSGNSTGLACSIGEVAVLNAKVDQLKIIDIVTYLNSKWGIGLASTSVSNGHRIFENTTTVDGSTVRIFTPPKPAENAPLIIWSHQQGGTEAIDLTAFNFPFVYACMSLGWYFVASSMGGVSSWGNASAQTALLNLYNLMAARRPFSKVILIGASMGGLATAVAVINNTVPNVKGAYLIDPALSLLDMYKSAGYSSTIDTGYNIIAGTLAAPAIAGANSISSSVSYPAGTTLMIDVFGANPEQVVTGVPSGAGPYTIPLVGNLAFAHSTGMKISDYPSKTVGRDPMLASIANFNGLPVKFLSSPTDTTTVQSLHSIPFKARIQATAKESTIKNHKGGHLAYGSTDPRDFIEFVLRNIT